MKKTQNRIFGKSSAIKGLLILILSFFSNELHSQFFNNPESAAFDTMNNRYLISNVGTGNIVQIAASGDTSFFNTELTRTLGMEIVNGILFVTDFTGVVGFDLTTDQLVMTIPIPGMDVLNDLTSDSSGFLYVTDSGNGNIYRVKISDHTSSTIVSGIYWPNGILYDFNNNRIIFCAFGSNVPIRAIDPDDFSVSTIITTPYTDLDGLTSDNEGNFYVSSWGSNSIYKYDNNFSSSPELISDNHSGPADIFLNKMNNTLVVPNFNSNTVDFLVITSVSPDEDEPNLPTKFNLMQNYPNPFNPSTTIDYSFPHNSVITLKVYDVLGNEITTLVNEEKQAGIYEFEFNAIGLPSGIYFYQLKADDFTKTKKMILLK